MFVVAAVTSTVYAARIWARLFVSKNAGLDDLLMSIAMFPLLGLTVAVVLGKPSGSISVCFKPFL